MRFSATSLAAAAAVAPLFVSAMPTRVRRQEAGPNPTDIAVLQFADVLEQLETQFYSEALAKFQVSDFLAAGFTDATVPIQQFTAIQSDESTHETTLSSTITTLGASAITGCTFDFSSVLTSVSVMAPVARLVENVGVGAYLGAAHLISDPVLLTAAASILTVEARHQTILNVLNDGTAIPQAFDLPLLPQEVLAIAGGFVSGCNPGFTGLPPLTVTNTVSIQAGVSLTFSFSELSSLDESTLSCQMLAGGFPFSLSLPFNACVVPSGLTGPVAIYVTNDTQPLNNNARDRFLGNIVAGPTMAFIDNDPQSLGALASGAGSVSSSSGMSSGMGMSSGSGLSSGSSMIDSTATISPMSASEIVSSDSQPTGLPSNDLSSGPLAVPSSANPATGPSADGSVNVQGWTDVTSSS